MNRTLLLAGGAIVAALAFWRPAAAPSPITISSPRPARFQHRHQRHSSQTAAATAVVYVAGAVTRPGLYTLPVSARVDEAVRRAGGMRADADPEAVNLAERISDGEEIRVVRAGESTPRPARRRAVRRVRATPSATVDVNTADAAALASLPGIGATLAARIVQYRELNGPFASIDELADVAGMTQRRIDSIAPFITLHDAP
jgi:competence protein ComEA